MNRSRFWLHLAFWLPFLLTLALILLDSETSGGVMDSSGATRHLAAMAACLVPLAWVVGARAYDAGASGWISVLAIPAAAALVPFSLLLLGLMHTSERRRATEAVSLWWVVPSVVAGIGMASLLSLMLRIR